MDILERIIKETKARVKSGRRTATIEALKLLPAFRAPTLSLRKSLTNRRLAVIAEVKKASPSRGVIQPDFDVTRIARSYRAAGATALSVLTEPEHFMGSLDHLAAVRMVVDLPILRKDFIVDPYQIIESRAWGADAVLLIAAVLERNQISELISAAEELDMECLIEVHNASELDKLDFTQVKLLGINNRDLKTFKVDTRRTESIVDLVPTETTIVSESGLRSGAEMFDLSRRGVDGFLIGTALMRARDPGEALARLLSEADTLMRSPSPLRRVAI